MFKRKYRKDRYRNEKQKKAQAFTSEQLLMEEERRVKSKTLTALIIIFSFILLIALLFLGAWFMCEIKQVKVEGNELYEDELIAEQVLNDEYSWNSLYVFLKYKFKKVENIPFIDKMKVQLIDRNTIAIHVYEKKLVGYTYVASTGQYAYFDKDGIVVERSINIIPDVAYIEGLNVTEVILYEKLQAEDDSVFKELLNITKALDDYEFMPEAIIVQNMGNFQFSYGDVLVNFGQAENVNDKVVRMKKIMESLEGKEGILHMENWKNEDSFIRFEETDLEEKNE